MGKDLKKRKAERKAKQLTWQLTKIEQSQKLPQKVAIPDYLDGQNYQLIFERYNHNECQLEQLESTSARAMINKLSMITRYNSKNIAGTNLIRDKVANAGNYAKLYTGLEPDIELKEIQFAGDGRIFCYLIDDHPQSDRVCNYCCIVAIKTQHVST